MSLRVGMSLANALAWSLKIPLAGIHLSELWSTRVNVQDFLWMHSTKKELIFVRGFGAFTKKWKDPEVITLDTLKHDLKKDTPFAGELLEEQRKALPVSEITSVLPLEEVLPDFIGHLQFSSEQLVPWYGRRG